MFFCICSFVAPEKSGARARFGAAAPACTGAGAQIKPMVVDDALHVWGNVEALAERRGHQDDGLALLRAHGIPAHIEIAEVFKADGMCVEPVNAGR